ncbi:MAG: hypothetical protein KA144_10935, partial [Xanthomonadaceae bacterium]|nr:hypothetical protein [Xanthomonadaceae bacterium]
SRRNCRAVLSWRMVSAIRSVRWREAHLSRRGHDGATGYLSMGGIIARHAGDGHPRTAQDAVLRSHPIACGAHRDPSDSAAGPKLAEQLFGQLMRDLNFGQQFWLAKKEWRTEILRPFGAGRVQ